MHLPGRHPRNIEQVFDQSSQEFPLRATTSAVVVRRSPTTMSERRCLSSRRWRSTASAVGARASPETPLSGDSRAQRALWRFALSGADRRARAGQLLELGGWHRASPPCARSAQRTARPGTPREGRCRVPYRTDSPAGPGLHERSPRAFRPRAQCSISRTPGSPAILRGPSKINRTPRTNPRGDERGPRFRRFSPGVWRGQVESIHDQGRTRGTWSEVPRF